MNRLPDWFRQDLAKQQLCASRQDFFRNLNLHTVCESAHCPNIGSCFSNNQATFLILGETCTRHCRFCCVKKGFPEAVDIKEPENLIRAIKELGLGYVVITSVTRDDLQDGGANQFARCVEFVRRSFKDVKIELLIPDFKGIKNNLQILVRSLPDIIGHNLEMVKRLYKDIRPEADYRLSLRILKQVKEINPSILTKSAIMVGLGESREETIELMQDLRGVDCDILTIGQYLAPSTAEVPVQRFLAPEEFVKLEAAARVLGFKGVLSAPLARSSYKAEEVFEKCLT